MSKRSTELNSSYLDSILFLESNILVRMVVSWGCNIISTNWVRSLNKTIQIVKM